MFYEPNSENGEIHNSNEECNEKYIIDDDNDISKRNFCIIVSVIGSVIILGVIIFLTIFFSSKKISNGGFIQLVCEVIDERENITVLNEESIDEDNYEIIANNTGLMDRYLRFLGGGLPKNRIDTNKKIGTINVTIKFKKEINSLSGMFSYIDTLKTVDFSEFKSKKIKSLDSTFKGCTNLEHINFGDFNSKKLESMSYTFDGCSNLIKLNLSTFETPRLKSMKSTFKDCINLRTIYMENFKLSNDVDKSNMFDNTTIKSITINDPDTKSFLKIDNYTDNTIKLCEYGYGYSCKECSGDICNQCNNGFYKPDYDRTICINCSENCEACDSMKCERCKDGYYAQGFYCFINETQPTIPTTTITTIPTTSINTIPTTAITTIPTIPTIPTTAITTVPYTDDSIIEEISDNNIYN